MGTQTHKIDLTAAQRSQREYRRLVHRAYRQVAPISAYFAALCGAIGLGIGLGVPWSLFQASWAIRALLAGVLGLVLALLTVRALRGCGAPLWAVALLGDAVALALVALALELVTW